MLRSLKVPGNNETEELTESVMQQMGAALLQGIVGLVISGSRRARPAPGHAAAEHPAAHHRGAGAARPH